MNSLPHLEFDGTRNRTGRRAALLGGLGLALIPAVPATAEDADAELHDLVAEYIAFRSAHEPGYRADLLRLMRGEPAHRTLWLLGTDLSRECFRWEQSIGQCPAQTPAGVWQKALLVAERYHHYGSGGFAMAGGLGADVLRRGAV